MEYLSQLEYPLLQYLKRKINNITLPTKVFITTSVIMFCGGLAVSKFLNDNLVLQIGEYVYSLDFQNHLENIKSLYKQNQETAFVKCNDCGYYYHYSWYYTLILYNIYRLGEVIGLNQFVTYFLINVWVQLLAFYLIAKLLLPSKNGWGWFIGFMFFTFSAYKVWVVGSGTLYGFIQGTLTIVLILFWYTSTNLKKLKITELAFLGLCLSLTLSFFSNLSANHYQILFYLLIFTGLYNIKNILKNITKFFIFAATTVTISIMLNYQFIASLITNVEAINSKNYQAYLPAASNTLEALTIKASVIIQNPNYTYIYLFFTFLTFFYFVKSSASVKAKITVVSVFTASIFVLLGKNFKPLDLYFYIFNYLPLMSSLRAAHRLYYILLLIQGVMIIYTWDTLAKKNIIKYVYIISLTFLLFTNITYAKKIYNFTVIPESYREVSDYMKNQDYSKATYLPFSYEFRSNMRGKYSWINNNKSNSSYHNPFNTIFLIKNLNTPHTGNYLLNPYSEEKINNLVLMDVRYNSEEEIVKGAVKTNAEYIILDGYFNWNNYGLNYGELRKSLELSEMYTTAYASGELKVYQKLGQVETNCINYYGNFTNKLGYCYSTTNPSVLIGKKPLDYTLEQQSSDVEPYKIQVLEDKEIVSNNFLSWEFYEGVLLKNKILFPENFIAVKGKANKPVFKFNVEPGYKYLVIPTYKTDVQAKPLKLGTIRVVADSKVISTIIPIAKSKVFTHTIVDLTNYVDKEVIIKTTSPDYYVFGIPKIYTKDQWEQVNQKVSENLENVTLE